MRELVETIVKALVDYPDQVSINETVGESIVISSIGRSSTGESLNMNADHVAERIADALGALKLIYLTDVQGVIVDKKLVPQIELKKAKELLKHKDIKGGMLPKFTCAVNAVKQGVRQVHIINGMIEHAVLLEIFTDVGIGSMIVRDLA